MKVHGFYYQTTLKPTYSWTHPDELAVFFPNGKFKQGCGKTRSIPTTFTSVCCKRLRHCAPHLPWWGLGLEKASLLYCGYLSDVLSSGFDKNPGPLPRNYSDSPSSYVPLVHHGHHVRKRT